MSEDREELIRTGRKSRKKFRKKEDNGKMENTEPRRRLNLDFEEEGAPVNRYYLKVSNRYRTAQYLSVVALVVFLVFMFIFFHNNITYANLLYLLRDLDSAADVRAGTYTDIDFDSRYMTDIRLYKNGISLLSKNEYKYFVNTGSTELDVDLAYQNPHLEVGDKFAMVADLGGNDYSIYSSLARVYTGTTEFAIEDMAIGDSGNYALLTRSNDSKFLVTCYGTDFNAKSKHFKDKYVTDVALSPDGKKLAIVSIDSDGTSLSCELEFGKIGADYKNVLTFDGQMPAWLSYAPDGTLILVCDKSIMGFEDEKLSWSYAFESESISKFSLDGNVLTLAISKNALGNENSLVCLNTSGKELAKVSVNRKLIAVASDGTDYAYVVGDGMATRLDMKKVITDEEKYDITVYRILAPQGSLMLCGPSGTVSLFNEK